MAVESLLAVQYFLCSFYISLFLGPITLCICSVAVFTPAILPPSPWGIQYSGSPQKKPLLTPFHPALCLLIKMQNARACRGGPTAIHLTLDIVDTLCVRRVVWMGIQ